MNTISQISQWPPENVYKLTAISRGIAGLKLELMLK
jgi:hypothetical protein